MELAFCSMSMPEFEAKQSESRILTIQVPKKSANINITSILCWKVWDKVVCHIEQRNLNVMFFCARFSVSVPC